MKFNKDIVSVFLLIALIVIICLPVFKNIEYINNDLDFLQTLASFSFMSDGILKHGQLPLWNPYLGGGYPVYSHPSSRILEPKFSVSLVRDPLLLIKLHILFIFMIGALGMYYLGRSTFKYNIPGAMFSSLAFCLSGSLYFVTMLRGNLFLKHYFYLPILLVFFLKSKEDRRFIYVTAILAAFLSHGALKFAAIFLFLALFVCLLKDRTYLKNLLLVCLWTVVLSMGRIISVAGLLRQGGYRMDYYELYGGGILSHAEFFERLKNIVSIFLLHGRHYLDIALKGYFPLYFYMGIVPFVFFAAGFFAERRQQLRLAVLLLVFLVLCFGTNTYLDIFRILNKVPGFGAMQKPAKYFIPIVTFIIALGSGRAFFLIDRLKYRKIVAAVFFFVALAGVTDLYLVNRPKKDIYDIPQPAYAKNSDFFQVKNVSAFDVSSLPGRVIPRQHAWELTFPTQYELQLQNIGKINAFTNIHIGEHAVPKYYVLWNGSTSMRPDNYSWIPNPSYRGEAYFVNDAKNIARFSYPAPNKFVVDALVVRPDRLVINQNFDRYWRSSYGKPVPHNGLISIFLTRPGMHRIILTYVPDPLYMGIGFSIVGLLLMAYYFLKEVRGRMHNKKEVTS